MINIYHIILILFLILIDLSSKAFIKNKFISFDNPEKIFSSNLLDIKNLCNHGISFGIFESISPTYLNILISIIIILLAIYLKSIIKGSNVAIYSYILIISGAISNFIDRIMNGCVYDFIDIHFYNYHWYVFNFADSYITLGGIILIFYLNNKKSFNNKTPQQTH